VLCEHASIAICRPAGRERHDDLHGPGRIVLGVGTAPTQQQRKHPGQPTHENSHDHSAKCPGVLHVTGCRTTNAGPQCPFPASRPAPSSIVGRRLGPKEGSSHTSSFLDLISQPANKPPSVGTIRYIQSWPNALPPTNSAGPKLRAGFTEAPETL